MVEVPYFNHKTDKTANIAICVPVRDSVTSVFAFCLAQLMKKCGEAGQRVQLFMVNGSEVAMQRQQLVDEALESSCTHILWIDSDMRFPADTIQRLLSHKKDIVGANYSTRVKPHRPVAFKSKENLDKRVFLGEGLEQVFAVGSGLLLVNRTVYENMSKPHYSVEWNENYTNLVGEDIYFCNKANDCNYKVFIDNDLSKIISHVGVQEFTIKGNCL